jgi:D-alanyl-D-alanine carboxypeptidase
VHLGTYGNRNEAERLLLQTALQDLTALEGAYRKIEPTHEKGRRVYRARFVGLTKTDAERACARLNSRAETCVTLSPGT